VSAEKRGALPERLAGFGNQVGGELPSVRNNRPDFQFNGNAGSTGTFGEARGVIAEHFVGAHVNEKRRKSGEVGVERRRERIAGIGVAKIITRGESDARAIEHGAAVGVSSNRVTSSGKIGPRRKEHCSGRERKACVAKSEHEREGETTACGLTSDDDAVRQMAST
jgi:hypothetical protein